MGRPRLFDTDAVVLAARDVFVRNGYQGASIDDLLRSTGLQRASLYSAFGSKRGLFIAALKRLACTSGEDLELLLVASMDLASSDAEVRAITTRSLARLENPAQILGQQILHRAGLDHASEERSDR